MFMEVEIWRFSIKGNDIIIDYYFWSISVKSGLTLMAANYKANKSSKGRLHSTLKSK